MPDKYFDNYIMPGRRINKHRGWEIYPEAIYDICKKYPRKLWKYKVVYFREWNGC